MTLDVDAYQFRVEWFALTEIEKENTRSEILSASSPLPNIAFR